MKITSKYVLREHLGPLTFSLSALTSLLLLNYISRRFGDLVGKGLPWQAIAEFFVLSVPFTIAMTLPMAVLVSVLYAWSRLASENEITAFKASGVSMGRLLQPVLVASVVTAAAMVFFNDQVLPRANHRLATLQSDIGRARPTFALKEQVINEVTDQFLLRAATVDRDRNTMQDVTIYDLSQTAPRTIRADSGALALAVNRKDLVLTLHDGSIVQLGEGRPDLLQRIFYTTNLVRVRDVTKSFDQTKPGEAQYKSDREMSICELQDSYLRSRREYLAAQLEYDRAVADSLKRPAPKEVPRRRVFLGLGRLYCEAVDAVKVRTAAASEPAPTVAQDTVRRPGSDTTRRPPADTAALPTPPTPTPTPPTPLPPAPLTPPPGTPTPLPLPPGALSLPPGQQPGVPVPGAPLPPGSVAPGAVPGAVLPPDSAALPGAVPVGPNPPATPPTTEPIDPGLGVSSVAIARLRLQDATAQMNGYDIEIHKKFALAVACIVFVLLGAPVALRFPRGGVGMVIGASLAVFALYYAFLIAGEELATRGYLPPSLAMWAANLLFGVVGLVLALRMGSETGSARGGGFGELLDTLRWRLAQRRTRARATVAEGRA